MCIRDRQGRGCNDLTMVGLATDYCVAWSALDGASPNSSASDSNSQPPTAVATIWWRRRRGRNLLVCVLAVGTALSVYIFLGGSGYYTFGNKVSERACTSELPFCAH